MPVFSKKFPDFTDILHSKIIGFQDILPVVSESSRDVAAGMMNKSFMGWKREPVK